MHEQVVFNQWTSVVRGGKLWQKVWRICWSLGNCSYDMTSSQRLVGIDHCCIQSHSHAQVDGGDSDLTIQLTAVNALLLFLASLDQVSYQQANYSPYEFRTKKTFKPLRCNPTKTTIDMRFKGNNKFLCLFDVKSEGQIGVERRDVTMFLLKLFKMTVGGTSFKNFDDSPQGVLFESLFSKVEGDLRCRGAIMITQRGYLGKAQGLLHV